MNELKQIKDQLATAIAQIEAYEVKQTKAESGRIRKTLGQIKKLVTPTRAALVAEDKA